MTYQPAPPPPRRKNHKVLWTLFGLLGVLMVGCGFISVLALGANPAPKGGEGVDLMPTPTASKQDVGKAKPPSPSPGKTRVQIAEGGYVVGEDVPPGKYRTSGARPELIQLCYWEVRTNGEPDGPIGPQGAVNGTEEQADVTLRKGDYFKTTGCERWTKR